MDTSSRKHRQTIRLNGYDYTACGAYFVTVCAHGKRCVFGRVVQGAMRLNFYGEMVRDEWLRTGELRANVILDEFVIMPNHFHAIVIITTDAIQGTTTRDTTRNAIHVGAHCNAPLRRAPNSLATIVSGFKGSATRKINQHRAENNLPVVRVWQRNYYERIIRDQKELDETRRYIFENPMNWATDENYI